MPDVETCEEYQHRGERPRREFAKLLEIIRRGEHNINSRNGLKKKKSNSRLFSSEQKIGGMLVKENIMLEN